MIRPFASLRLLGIALLATIFTAGPASAQTYTWTGGGGDANWSTGGNWGGTAPTSNLTNTLLVLTGNTQTTNTLDANLSANSLTFDAGAGEFTVNGTSTLTLGSGGITVLGASNQFFDANLALGAAGGTWANNGTGAFTVGGTVNNGGFLLTVGGSGTSSYDGIISGTGGLTKTGAGTVILNAANTYTGPTRIVAGTLIPGVNNAFASSRLELGDFTGIGTAAQSATGQINYNLGPTSQTVAGLYTFNVNTTGTPHTITIASGQTLTVSNTASGTHTAFAAYGNAAGNQQVHSVSFTGGGSFVVDTPNGFIVFGQTGGAAGNQLPAGYPQATTHGSNTTVNLSGLSSFTANVAAFRVGDFTSTTNNGTTTLTLAPATTITANDFFMGSGRSNLPVTVNLGTGVNTINATNIFVGGDPTTGGIANPRSRGVLQYLAANTTGSLVIRGKAGGSTPVTLFNLGLQQNGSGTHLRDNVVNLNGHNVDMLLNTFQVGGIIGGTSTANTGEVRGTFSFNQGTVVASTLAVGNRIGTTAAQNNFGAAVGVVNIGGGTLTVTGSGANALRIGVNTQTSSAASTAVTYTTTGTVNVSGGALTLSNGGITLATSTGSYASGAGSFVTSGTLNITGGTVTVGGDIVSGAATSPGTATSSLILNGASAVLNLNGNRIGGTTAGSAIDVLTLQEGTLRNVLEINNGAGLTKNTTGTLTLAGTNSYTGGTTVSNGTLLMGAANTLPSTGAVTVDAPGILNLNDFGQTIASLAGSGSVAFGSGPHVLTIGGTNSSSTFSGVLSGVGNLTKVGTGTLTLSGNNTYDGTTTVNGGTLLVNGQAAPNSGTGLSSIVVNNGGTIGGTGRTNAVTFQVNTGGTIRGGDAAGTGTLTVNGLLSLGNGAIVGVRVNDATPTTAALGTGGSTEGTVPNPTSNNFLHVTNGGLSWDPATAIFTIDGTGTPLVIGQTYSYQIGQVDGQNLSAINITNQAQFSATGFSDPVTFSVTGGATGQVYLNMSPVPEPATVLGLAAGVLGLGGLIRRRASRRA